MMKHTRHLCIILAGALAHPTLAGEATLDTVLAELGRLNESVIRLEQRIDELEQGMAAAATEGVAAGGSAEAGPRSGFIERVVDAVALREQRINFPWMDVGLWDSLQAGMDPAEVKAILGEPTLEDPSLHKRIDFVYTYSGYRPATGEKVVGKVKFYKGRVAVIEAP